MTTEPTDPTDPTVPTEPTEPLRLSDLDLKAIRIAKALAADAVEKAGSGHPGTAISLAPVAYLLYQHEMAGDPSDARRLGRDRFVLSAGHASVLQYIQLVMTGYGLEVSDLQALRTAGSLTPGHPEFGHTKGVETTTGPLGAGFSNAVGMAMAARYERGLLDPDAPAGESIFDHFVYTVLGDGCMQEGVAAEAASLAGTQQLGNLIAIYDDNDISIEGNTDIAFAENPSARFEAYGWQVLDVDWTAGGEYREDLTALHEALVKARAETSRPSLIRLHTIIAWPAPTKQGQESSHGAALGAEEVAGLKKALGLDPDALFQTDGVLDRTRARAAERAEARRAAQLAVASRVRDQARTAVDVARAWIEEAQGERARIEAERAEASAATGEVRAELDALAAELSQLTDAAHRDEVARAEQRMRLESLAERAMNELGLELEPLVEEYGPHMLVPATAEDGGADGDAAVSGGDGTDGTEGADGTDDDGAADRRAAADPGRPYVRAEQERRLARASRDLARLGKVNPLALEEHAALEQRHQFLAEQLADLKSSREDLLRIVEEIDTRVQEVFTRAFEDTARQFAEVFDRLFPGGEGRLVLTDPGDMLATGIEIEARPAGKKVKRLSLLSGGERSLAAVALLIAIFKARPSPFYVMDEVEAALDDTNLERLLEIFTELRQSSQLIIITHQKRTMEVADALYGISMRDGITKAISQRLAHKG